MNSIFNEKDFSDSILNLFESEAYKNVDWEKIQDLREISFMFLKKIVLESIERINNINLSLTESEKILNELINIKNNEDFIMKIQKGMDVLLDNDDRKHLFLIDYENIKNNEFFVSNENYFKGSDNLIRIDCVCYVNGFPLIILEYKSIFSNSLLMENEKLIDSAITQVNGCKENNKRGYLQKVPGLFKYNAIVIIAHEKIARVGTHQSNFEHFSDWLYIESDSEKPNKEKEKNIVYLIKGLLNKKRFIEYIRHFIFFKEEINNKILKIHAKYHQFYAVQSLYNSIISAQKSEVAEVRNKGGYAYQAPASGKSFEMMMLVHKLQITDANYTFLLVTDRNSLDEQLTNTFRSTYKYFGLSEKKSIKVFGNREDLKNALLKQRASGIFFTTIQKFDDFKMVLSDRKNIIVIVDEAHRTQNLSITDIEIINNESHNKLGWAQNMRNALFNATFVGFTGTPLYKKDKSTKNIFGDEVTRYDMKQASDDKSIVQIILEYRHWLVSIVASEKQKMIKILELEYQKNTNIEVLKKLQAEYLQEEKIILNSSQLIHKIAQNIVDDYTNEIKNSGTWIPNAMLIVSSKKVALKYYKEIVEKIKPDWKDSVDIVVSIQQKKDDDELIALMSKTKNKIDNFKNPDHPFRFVILVDMWTTGFDTPQIKKMYLVKRIKEHTLIQTISRVTRLYKDKEYGVIIDYLGLEKAFEEAFKIYSNEEIKVMSNDLSLIYEDFKKQYQKLKDLFSEKYFETCSIIKLDVEEQKKKIFQIGNYLINKYRLDNIKKIFTSFSKMWRKYILLPVTDINDNERDFICGVRMILGIIKPDLNQDDYGDLKRITRDLNYILEDILNIESEVLLKEKINISEKMFEQKLPELAVNTIINILAKSLEISKIDNIIMANELSEKIDKIIERYNNYELNVIEVKLLLEPILKELMSSEVNLENKIKLTKEEKTFYDILRVAKTDIDLFLAAEVAKKLNNFKISKNWESYFENIVTTPFILKEIRDILYMKDVFSKEEIELILKNIKEQYKIINQ